MSTTHDIFILGSITAGVVAWGWVMWRAGRLRRRIEAADRRSRTAAIEAADRLRQLEAQAHAMAQLRALLEDLARKSPVGLVAVDETRVLWANRAAEDVTGVPLRIMTTTAYWELIHPDDRPASQDAVDQNVSSGRTLSKFRNRWVNPETGDTHVLRWTSTPFENGMAYCVVEPDQEAV